MFRELSILLQANLNVVSGLDILIKTEKNNKKNRLLNNIRSDISAGLSFSKACLKYPQYYSGITCKLLEAGERAAALPQVLNYVADYLEKTQEFKSKLYKSLIYPVLILITAIIIAFGLLYFVVPQFERLFSDLGAQLPYLTRCVIGLADIVRNHTIKILFFMIIILFYVFRKIIKLNIHIPVYSPFKHKIKIIYLTRTWGMLLAAGVSLIDGVSLTQEWSVRDKILRGEKLSNALHCVTGFSPMMISLISVGEASGRLSEMLGRIAVITESELDNKLNKLMQLVEPCLMILMGILIGGLVIAMYLPVFQLGRVV